MKTTLAYKIAQIAQARKNCQLSNNTEWFEKHSDVLDQINELLPSGSGIDSGCKIDLDATNRTKIVINVPFHVMDENGYYDGWVDYKIIVTPAFYGIDIKITGRDKNGLKDYLMYIFYDYLTAHAEYDPSTNKITIV